MVLTKSQTQSNNATEVNNNFAAKTPPFTPQASFSGEIEELE